MGRQIGNLFIALIGLGIVIGAALVLGVITIAVHISVAWR